MFKRMTRSSPPSARRPENSVSHTLKLLQTQGGAALWLSIAAPILAGVLLVWQAWILASTLGQAIENVAPISTLLPGIFILLGIVLARAGLSAIADHTGIIAAERIKLHLRQTLFSQLLAKPPRAANSAASGLAAASIVDQVEALESYFARYISASAQGIVLPLVFGAIILPIDWVAGVLFLVSAPLIPIFMALVGWGAQVATDRQAKALSHLSGRFSDRLRGLLTLKLLGREEAETEGIVSASEALRQRTLKVLRIAFLSSAVLEFFAALGVAGVALYVGLTFIDYLHLRTSPLTLQLGMFLLLMAPEVYNPLRVMAAQYHDRASAKAALNEIEANLGTLSDERVDHTDNAPLPGKPIALEANNVTLRTPDHMRAVIEHVTLRVEPGQHIALLGPSGSGKSTLLEALVGLRDAEGDILLDGRPLSEWSEPSLRGRTFILTQKPRIIHASLADNMALGRPAASRADIEKAAELSGVLGFTAGLPLGLDTIIGEDGAGISGGQAQRVALARLFLRDAGLIILDEPTAHLDAALEQEIIQSITRYARGRTLIVATHSPAVAKNLDRAWRVTPTGLVEAPLSARAKGVA